MKKTILSILFIFLSFNVARAIQTQYVQIRVSETVLVKGVNMTYNDALYYPIGKVPLQIIINAEIAKRIAAWKAAIENPPSPAPLTKTQMLNIMTAIDAEKQNLDTQKTEYINKLSISTGEDKGLIDAIEAQKAVLEAQKVLIQSKADSKSN
jgi:hypothetical protein